MSIEDQNNTNKAVNGSFVGLKFSRNMSGTWNMKQGSENNRGSVEEVGSWNENLIDI